MLICSCGVNNKHISFPKILIIKPQNNIHLLDFESNLSIDTIQYNLFSIILWNGTYNDSLYAKHFIILFKVKYIFYTIFLILF